MNEEGLSPGQHDRGEFEEHIAFHHQQVCPLLDQVPKCGTLLSLGELILQLDAEGGEEGAEPLNVADEGGAVRVQSLQKCQHLSQI